MPAVVLVITLAGVAITARARLGSLAVHDANGDSPSTCGLTIQGAAPLVAQPLRVTVDGATRFSGVVQSVDLSYESVGAHVAYRCTAVSDAALLLRRLPFGTFADVSATEIAEYLARLAGLKITYINPGLPLVTLTFNGGVTGLGGLSLLAKRIGGRWYVLDGVLHFFLPGEDEQFSRLFLFDFPPAGVSIRYGPRQASGPLTCPTLATVPASTGSVTVSFDVSVRVRLVGAIGHFVFAIYAPNDGSVFTPAPGLPRIDLLDTVSGDMPLPDGVIYTQHHEATYTTAQWRKAAPAGVVIWSLLWSGGEDPDLYFSLYLDPPEFSNVHYVVNP